MCVVAINLCGLLLNLDKLSFDLSARLFMLANCVCRPLCGQHLGTHLNRKLDGSRLLPYMVSMAMEWYVSANVIRKSPPLSDSIVTNRGLRLVVLVAPKAFCNMSLVRLLLLNTAPWLVRPGYILRRRDGN